MMTSQTKTGRCALTAKNPKLTAAMTAAEKYLGLLLWTLYHHQGGSSNIGQPIRRSLGMGQYDLMTDEQIAYGKAAADFYHSTGKQAVRAMLRCEHATPRVCEAERIGVGPARLFAHVQHDRRVLRHGNYEER